MQVRGAPLIGVTAAYGVCAGAARGPVRRGPRARPARACAATRPTAVNLRWALDEMRAALRAAAARASGPPPRGASRRRSATRTSAINRAIGEHGLALIASVSTRRSGRAVNILTHCNAGWLATVDWGTALAPIYLAHDAGIAGARLGGRDAPAQPGRVLTAWELARHGVPHTVIADNAGGHLMQHGEVDLCIVGTDRVDAPRRRRATRSAPT